MKVDSKERCGKIRDIFVQHIHQNLLLYQIWEVWEKESRRQLWLLVCAICKFGWHFRATREQLKCQVGIFSRLDYVLQHTQGSHLWGELTQYCTEEIMHDAMASTSANPTGISGAQMTIQTCLSEDRRCGFYASSGFGLLPRVELRPCRRPLSPAQGTGSQSMAARGAAASCCLLDRETETISAHPRPTTETGVL